MAQNREVLIKKKPYAVTVTLNAKEDASLLRFQMIRLTRYRLKRYLIWSDSQSTKSLPLRELLI